MWFILPSPSNVAKEFQTPVNRVAIPSSTLRALWSDCLGGGAFVVQGEQLFEQLLVGKVGGPAVGGEDGFVQRAVRVQQHCGGSLYRLVRVRFFRSSSGVSGGFSQRSRFSTNSFAAAAMLCTRGSSCGSWPGGHGNGKVSKHDPTL